MAKYFTKQNARAIGLLGGRPKGVLDKKTIERIKTKEAVQEIIQKKAGLIIDNLLIGSNLQDTAASKELLERAFGKIPQGVNIQAVQFSLKELADYRKAVQQDVPQITPPNPTEAQI